MHGNLTVNFSVLCSVFTFPKHQKLKSRKQIDLLFAQGKAIQTSPVKLTYLYLPQGTTLLQMGVVASKRHFKKAVHRNRAKRLMREAFRLQQQPLHNWLQQHGGQLFLFLSYNHHEIITQQAVIVSVEKILRKLIQKLPTHVVAS
ncbi:MAG TPA: ribonuclease P protein component [Chitinophagaceae bacterium]|nr:ribonuclease P protein component [Chitinophagaceae bacterium]